MSKLDSYRKKYYENKINNAVINKGGRINFECKVAYPENVIIGKGTYINGGHIFASPNANITIGENCLISYNVHMRTDTHIYIEKDTPINIQGHIEKDIVVEDDVWIGYGAQIMQGITLKKGSVIGAGAIVTKDTQPYGIYAGVPARKIKERE
ncbi:acyltransferase [Metabacillus idriensis]|uniref:acyltransferase n=1 Tax=Metabacillus idriensis TaxID=324768 RepID=UPI00203A9B98|nr:acyltransferase [Metabacillus idriensis]MCM3597517.1 acyltransferase [Metabacillus idriensis]